MTDEDLLRMAAHTLHRDTAGHGDRHTRDLLHRVLCGLGDGSMRELDDAIRRVGQYLDRQMDKRHDYMRAYGASPSTIRDRSGITQAYQRLQEQVLAPINAKALGILQAELNPITMTTKTSIELQAELAAVIQAEEIAAERAARATKLNAYGKLAAATTILLNRMKEPTTAPDGLLAQHRFELKALAAEFGYRIVLVGDRTTAVLVQA